MSKPSDRAEMQTVILCSYPDPILQPAVKINSCFVPLMCNRTLPEPCSDNASASQAQGHCVAVHSNVGYSAQKELLALRKTQQTPVPTTAFCKAPSSRFDLKPAAAQEDKEEANL